MAQQQNEQNRTKNQVEQAANEVKEKQADNSKKQKQEENRQRVAKKIELELSNANDSLSDVKKNIDKYGMRYTILTNPEIIVSEELRSEIYSYLNKFSDNYRHLKREINQLINAWQNELLHYSMPRWSNPVRNDIESIELESKRKLVEELEGLSKQL